MVAGARHAWARPPVAAPIRGESYGSAETGTRIGNPLVNEVVVPTPFKDGYAYGWGIRDASPATFGYRQIAHSGGINGFSSMIIRLPEPNVTAIVLSNNAAAPAAPIARDLLAIYFGASYGTFLGATYAAVDILPDPRIRQELSAISGWPTIPQLFHKGELIGGCDIVTEMYETGELAERLRGDTRLHILQSLYGHDAFLKEGPAISAILSEALAGHEVAA